MAKRIANHSAHLAIAELQEFKGNNLRGTITNGEYEIYSYWTKMVGVDVATGRITYRDDRRYSVTTSKHQGKIGQGLSGRMQSLEAVVFERE